MADRPLPPVQGEGLRNGRTVGDIPDGYITWEEHYEAWADYHKRHPQQSAEDIANRGGFGYKELVEHLGHHPKTWRPRDLVRFADFTRDFEPEPEQAEQAEGPEQHVGLSHIVLSTGETLCKMQDDTLPEVPFNFDNTDGMYCTECCDRMLSWLKRWMTK